MILEKLEKQESDLSSIKILTTKYLNDELAKKIATMQWNRADWFESVRWLERDSDEQGIDFLQVVALAGDNVVGRLQCLQNQDDGSLWYYGDLLVAQDYRRQHIAERLLKMAIDALEKKGCKTIRCYVEPDNPPSLQLQRKLGFVEKPYQKFNNLNNDGQLMFEKNLCMENVFISDFCDKAFQAAFKKYFAELGIDVKDWDGLFLEMNEQDENKAYVRLDNGEVIGFIQFIPIKFESWFFSADYGFIREFWVSEEHRNKEHGCELLECAEKYFISEGITAAILTTKTAEKFYEKHGYEKRTNFFAKNNEDVFVKMLR